MLSSNDLTIAAAAGYFDAYKLDRLRILYLTSRRDIVNNCGLQDLHCGFFYTRHPKLLKYQVQTTFSRPSHLVIKTE